MWRFQRLRNLYGLWGTSWLDHAPVAALWGLDDAPALARPRFYGALLSLFGPPDEEGGDALFLYVLAATLGDGRETVLTAYDVGLPAIGGHVDDSLALRAAGTLLEVLGRIAPADHRVTRYLSEYATTETFGCRDGVCFVRSEIDAVLPPWLHAVAGDDEPPALPEPPGDEDWDGGPAG